MWPTSADQGALKNKIELSFSFASDISQLFSRPPTRIGCLLFRHGAGIGRSFGSADLASTFDGVY